MPSRPAPRAHQDSAIPFAVASIAGLATLVATVLAILSMNTALTVTNGVACLAVLGIAGCLYRHRRPQEQSSACEGILQQSTNLTKLGADDLLEEKRWLGLVEECVGLL